LEGSIEIMLLLRGPMYYLSSSYDYEAAISYIGCINAARLFIENYYTRGTATYTLKEIINQKQS